MIKIPNLTTYYNLNKPLGSEKVDVNVLNENMDILDANMKAISVKTEIAHTHSQSEHARTDATKIEKSDVNGNIKINGAETIVYTHPGGTNPHGTTKFDVGLGSVDNTSDMNKPISTAQKAALDAKVDKVPGKGLSTNDYTTTEKNKLAGIANGAEVNQNAFSNVKVGSVTVSADAKTDTLELVAGTNITITPDATNDKITISSSDTKYTHPSTSGNKHIPSGGSSGQILRWSSDGTAVWGNDNNTVNTAGATNSTSKLFIIGATAQSSNPQTYSRNSAYIGTDGCLYSNNKKVTTLIYSSTEPSTNLDLNMIWIG